jgi:hypothetical protein
MRLWVRFAVGVVSSMALVTPSVAHASTDAAGDALPSSADLVGVGVTTGSTSLFVTVTSTGPNDISNDAAWSDPRTHLDLEFDTNDDGTADVRAVITFDATSNALRAPVTRLSDGAHLCDMVDHGGWDTSNLTRLDLETQWACLGSTTIRVGARFVYATTVAGAPAVDIVGLGAVRSTGPAQGISSGFWTVAADGGVFSQFEARFHGSAGGTKLNRPVVGMAATPTGSGYWLVASDGGIFSYGDAAFYGSTGAMTLNKPIVGMATNQAGTGYWLAAADGGVFAFGKVQFCGANPYASAPAVGIESDAYGYHIARSDGSVDNDCGPGRPPQNLLSPIVGMAALPGLTVT